MGTNKNKSHHHILPTSTAVTIGGILLVMTVVTVAIARVDLGRLNFTIAMAVATVKALLVCLYFMGLKYDHRENAMIFATSFLFLAIFIGLTSTDMFFRGDIYTKGPVAFVAKDSGSKVAKPWISTPELVARGKELFAQQCVACHGAEGRGNGPAAAALNPPPRNFHEATGWKNGRKPTMVFKTLKEGLAPSAMASYASLPAEDRWALSHYVLSMGPAAETDTAGDFAKIGVDPTQNAVAEKVQATVPVSFAMKRIASYHPSRSGIAHLYSESSGESSEISPSGQSAHALGAALYRAQCVSCHGVRGEGAIKVKTLGANPVAYVTTRPFQAYTEAMKSESAFTQAVIKGLPGELMPGLGQLGAAEARDLYQYVQSLK
ncbi:MAG: c-type cytochrome [Bdellovibrionia bacterium]